MTEKCVRCGKNIDHGDNEWEAFTLPDGDVVVVCDDCITPEEQQAIDESDMQLGWEVIRDQLESGEITGDTIADEIEGRPPP